MNFQSRSARCDTRADNVIVFPRAHRVCLASFVPSQRGRRPADLTDADLNLRLLALLGICMTSATLALSAVHVLHG